MNSRRAFLKTIGGVSLSALAGSFPSLLHANTGTPSRTLLVLFQRGGADGINGLVPYADPDYAGSRPTTALAPPGQGVGSCIDIDGYFGLHPALSPLASLFQAGNLALFPTVQHDANGRSHFGGQDIIEQGDTVSRPDGWLSRALSLQPGQGPLPAVALARNVPKSLHGPRPVTTIRSLRGFKLDGNPLLADYLRQLHTPGFLVPDGASGYHRSLPENGQLLMQKLNELAAQVNAEQTVQNGAQYPASKLGQNLQDAAQIIRAGLGVRVLTVDQFGWDTHSGQGGATGTQADLMSDMAGSLAAFHQDLGARMQDVMVVVMTEFGRTVKENASGGTDHGNAALWYVLGGNTLGGVYSGNAGWPGLNEEALFDGRDLMHVFDFRHILAEIVSTHLGITDLATVFPEFNAQTIGFLA